MTTPRNRKPTAAQIRASRLAQGNRYAHARSYTGGEDNSGNRISNPSLIRSSYPLSLVAYGLYSRPNVDITNPKHTASVYKKIGISALQRQLTIAQAEMQHDIPIFPIGVNLSRSPFGFTIAIELDDTASETIMTDKKIAAEALELEEPRGARMLQIGNYDTLEQAGEAARHVRTYLDELPKDHPFMTLAPARIKVFQSL